MSQQGLHQFKDFLKTHATELFRVFEGNDIRLAEISVVYCVSKHGDLRG